MRKNNVQCDACCKVHPVDDEYDVSHLPQGWYTVIPGQGGGFKETMHFCSTKCLADWVEKVQIVVMNCAEKRETNEAFDHVEECLDNLRSGIMVGLRPMEATLGKRWLESQIKVVESVKEEFNNLSEAIKALRKDSE